MIESYTNSDEYQKEIEKQYKKRVTVFDNETVIQVCKLLNVSINNSELSQATAGNINTTYITNKYVIKINKLKEEPSYKPNKIIEEMLGVNSNVVEVIEYDFFDKTPYEVLIMSRASGTTLLNDIFTLSKNEIELIFEQVLSVVQKMLNITFDSFGNMNKDINYEAHTEYLKYTFAKNVEIIRNKKLCKEEDIIKIERYFLKHVGIFDNEKPVFVHNDLHMGNIMHDGDILTAIIDFDHSLKAPACRVLLSIIGFIDMPQQFVEGTKDFEDYKGKNFHYLLPILKEKLHKLFDDPLLIRKLNILGLRESIDWVAADWSTEWNKETIVNILDKELPKTDKELEQTYYAQALVK